ncbi:hypothetical protein V2J09_017099 [Rumex salicifolius]
MHLPYLPGESKSALVDRSLQKREEVINMLKFHLLRAQNRMKQYVDAHRSPRTFDVGDSVYLKLQPYRQRSLKGKIPHKLSPRYYGPFLVIDKIGPVAYKLQLPPGAAVHNVFHPSSSSNFLFFIVGLLSLRQPLCGTEDTTNNHILLEWLHLDYFIYLELSM